MLWLVMVARRYASANLNIVGRMDRKAFAAPWSVSLFLLIVAAQYSPSSVPMILSGASTCAIIVTAFLVLPLRYDPRALVNLDPMGRAARVLRILAILVSTAWLATFSAGIAVLIAVLIASHSAGSFLHSIRVPFL